MTLNLGVKTSKCSKTEVAMRSAVKNYPRKVISRLFSVTFHFRDVTSVTCQLHGSYLINISKSVLDQFSTRNRMVQLPGAQFHVIAIFGNQTYLTILAQP